MKAPVPGSILLAIDTGSPKLSLALGRDGEILAERVADSRKASERLLEFLDEALEESGVLRAEIGGVLALRGPGSFTGLRIGLATALALAESLSVPATALPTLQVLAFTVRHEAEEAGTGLDAQGVVIAAVDALRGDWFAQAFVDGRELAAPRRLPLDQLATVGNEHPIRAAVGFGLSASLGEHLEREGQELSASELTSIEPPALATAALRLIHQQPLATWNTRLLTEPLYLRAPNIRVPAPRGGQSKTS